MRRIAALLLIMGLLLPALMAGAQEYCNSVLALRLELDERIYATRTQRKSARSVRDSLAAAKELRNSLDALIKECTDSSAIEQAGQINANGIPETPLSFSEERGSRLFIVRLKNQGEIIFDNWGKEEMLSVEVIYNLGRRYGLTEQELISASDTVGAASIAGMMSTYPSAAIDNHCPTVLLRGENRDHERVLSSMFSMSSEVAEGVSDFDSEKDAENIVYLLDVLSDHSREFLKEFCQGVEQMWAEG